MIIKFNEPFKYRRLNSWIVKRETCSLIPISGVANGWSSNKIKLSLKVHKTVDLAKDRPEGAWQISYLCLINFHQ